MEIKFRYNKYSHRIFQLVLVLAVFAGLFLDIFIINGLEYISYFDAHPKYAIYVIFGSIPVFMFTPAIITYLWWRKKDEQATLKLYENHAILYYKDREIMINKGQFKLTIESGFCILKTPIEKICMHYSIKERTKEMKNWSTYIKKGTRPTIRFYYSSLFSAMEKLMYYDNDYNINENTNNNTNDKGYSTKFYEIDIIIGITTPEIFNNSKYYVDYNDIITVEDAPFVCCNIIDKKNSKHLVGNMLIDIRFLNDNDYNEKKLSKQSILEIIELDEWEN
ncbi:hypothetical protein [Oceanivirga salmonicida]|uniref:hypothetical protein n=1 Tax=Oceanivirga salmonicida TaxID=1769291 RepID=UPI0012E13D9F|nr:hypothetical protein [Oceanivirga salmonicida]